MSDTAVVLPFPAPVEPLDDADLSTPDCLAFYRKLAAGVTVVTAGTDSGPVGATASAVTSVSLRPPLLLACLATGSRTMSAIRARQAFAVHLLSEHQRHLSSTFAGRGDRFAGHRWRTVLGVPVLAGTAAWAVCLLAGIHRYGDHDLAVGRLVAAHTGHGRPLVWHDRTYWHLDPA